MVRSILTPAPYLPDRLPTYAHVQSYVGCWENVENHRGYFISEAFPYTRYYSDAQDHGEVRFDRPAPFHVLASWGILEALRRRVIVWPLTLLFIGTLSYVSGGLAGLVVLRGWRDGARLGLWNLLTLLAVAVRSANDGATRNRAGTFTLTFTAIYVSLGALGYMLIFAMLDGPLV